MSSVPRSASHSAHVGAASGAALERGFSLIEAITGTVIAILAVMGLAYSFGVGRGLIYRYEIARAATGVAQGRMEALSVVSLTSPDLAFGTHPPLPFAVSGAPAGTEYWTVTAYDDPAVAGATDMKLVTVVVRWSSDAGSDSVAFTRLFQNR